MSNFEHMKEIITAMSGTGENILAVNKSYLEFMGSLEGGVFLSQLIFFSDKSKRTDGFFYKTYDDWKEHTYLSEYNIRKQTKLLVEQGVLETKIKKANGNPTLHYKFDMDAFVPLFISFLKNRRNETENFNPDSEIFKERSLNNEASLTEITTETTTEINNDDDKATPEKIEQPIIQKQNPFQFYQENGFGILSSITQHKIGNWIDDLSDELVVLAMQKAIEQNRIKWAYAETILKDWYHKNIRTVEQVQALDAQFEATRSNYQANNNQPYKRGAKPNGSNQGQSSDATVDAEKRRDEYLKRFEGKI